MNRYYDKNTLKDIFVQTTNLCDIVLSTTGKITIYRVNSSQNKSDGTQSTPIMTSDFKSGEPISVNWKNYDSGKYLLVIDIDDCKLEESFVLYGMDDKQVPIETPLWIVAEKSVSAKSKTNSILVWTALDTARSE